MGDAQMLEHWESRIEQQNCAADATLTVRADEHSRALTVATSIGHDKATILSDDLLDLDPDHASKNLASERQRSRTLAETLRPAESDIRRRYQLKGLLGSGGMGQVLLAEHTELAREMAIKILRHGQVDKHTQQAFKTEVKVVGLLEHPSIIPVHDAGNYFYVMKKVEGKTLEALLDDGCSIQRAVEILIRIGEAVAFAHSRGIIHRDIKPSNIMVGAFGEVLLLDWGLALCVDAKRSDPRHDIPPPPSHSWIGGGTPAYLAPEMVASIPDQLSYHSDVFLMGATLYRCLTGHPPYGRDHAFRAIRSAARCDFPSIVEHAPDAPHALAGLATAATQKDPAERPDMLEFLELLQEWQRHSGASVAAQNALAEGEAAQLRAQDALTAQQAYEAWQQAIAAFERAWALDPGCTAALSGRHQAREGYAQRALASGDFTLAAVIVAKENADDRTDTLSKLASDIAEQHDRRRRRDQRLQQSRRLVFILLIGLLALTAYEAWFAL